MKVICDAPGQTCNRLWSYVATIAECIVRKKKMVILFYDYTIEDFPNLKNCPFIYFPLYHKKWLEKGNNWNRFKGLTWKATHSDWLDRIYHFLGFSKGWHTRRDIRYIQQAKKEIIKIYTPEDAIVNRAQSLIQDMRKECDMIIGVHIRRGDYKTWNEGKFYFSWEVYDCFMKRLEKLYSDCQIAFFISSNEAMDENVLKNHKCYFHEKVSSPILDLYTLSLCDRIIGPVSSFSRWASFYGEKPLCFLYGANQVFTEESFSPIVDYLHFQNGIEVFDW